MMKPILHKSIHDYDFDYKTEIIDTGLDYKTNISKKEIPFVIDKGVYFYPDKDKIEIIGSNNFSLDDFEIMFKKAQDCKKDYIESKNKEIEKEIDNLISEVRGKIDFFSVNNEKPVAVVLGKKEINIIKKAYRIDKVDIFLELNVIRSNRDSIIEIIF